LVIVQLPGTLAHGTCELQAACVLAQVPIDEQSEELRHVIVASFAQVPSTSGHVPGSAVQAAPPLLQVPLVRHWASADAWSTPLQGCCDHGWPFCLEQVPGVVGQFAADEQSLAVHAWPPHWAVVVHAVVPLGQVFCAQAPPLTAGQLLPSVQDFVVQAPLAGQFALLAHAVVPSGQVFWLQVPLMVVHCATEVHTWPGGLLHWPQSVGTRQTVAPLLLHVPTPGQSVLNEQVILFLTLQCPPSTAQSLTDVHRLPSVLQ
jgi:hypothetical protein